MILVAAFLLIGAGWFFFAPEGDLRHRLEKEVYALTIWATSFTLDPQTKALKCFDEGTAAPKSRWESAECLSALQTWVERDGSEAVAKTIVMRDPNLRDNPFAGFAVTLFSAFLDAIAKCANDYECTRRLATIELPGELGGEGVDTDAVVDGSHLDPF